MTRLYLRIFLAFCAANLLTLLVTIWVTQRIAYSAYTNLPPDWESLASEAASVYDRGGEPALSAWSRGMQVRGIEVAMYSAGKLLLERAPPEALAGHLDELQAGPDVELHPAPNVALVGVLVERPGREAFRFLATRDPSRSATRVWLLVANQLAVSVLVIAVLGGYLTRSISSPVREVQVAARRLAQGERLARVSEPTSTRADELGQLARDFNSMAGRVEASVEHMRSLLQDVSHELRSPLARLQLEIELAGDGAPGSAEHLARARAEVGKLDRLLDEVLALARLEAGVSDAGIESVELSALLPACVAEVTSEAQAHGCTVAFEAPALAIPGDPALLTRALRNLLQNALKFAAGREVILRASREGQRARIEVLDRGPGVPEDQLEAIFRPFFRGAGAGTAPGTGLGLAIVQRVALAHHGRAMASNRPGGGLCVSLELPIA